MESALPKLDRLDLALIDVLQQDGTLTLQHLKDAMVSRKITRDLSSLSRRIDRLKDEGYISIVAVPNYERIGLPHISLIAVRIARTDSLTLRQTCVAFEETIRVEFPSVILSHKVDGEWSYVLKVLARDKTHFDHIHARLADLDAVDNLVTMNVMGQFIARVPIDLVDT